MDRLMKKFKILPFMLLPLVLNSCGKDKLLGTYSFQLGKDSGTHFGIFATVTNKNYVYTPEGGEEKIMGKTMNVRLKMGTNKLGTFFDELNISDVTIPTYYKIGKELPLGKGNVFHFGFNIKDVIEVIIPEEETTDTTTNPLYYEGEEGTTGGEGTSTDGDEDPWEEFSDIKPEDTEKIVYSYINGTTLTFNIPVSMPDLQFQLYWYGLDIEHMDTVIDAHEIGTHPTEEDVRHINEDLKYPENHEDNVSFRDFHTLSLALSKK